VATRTVVPGFLTVAGAAEHLRLAPRSVRDLIYAGRLPSVRLGRVHFLSVADVEHERRRRLGLPLPARPSRPRRPRQPRPVLAERPAPTPRRASADQSTRAQRAAERAELLDRWLHAHRAADPHLPFDIVMIADATTCAACHRQLRPGARAVTLNADAGSQLCTTCGRRALLDWADERRREAIAARRLASDVRFVTADHSANGSAPAA
jgi:hypothetical protein